MCDISFLKIRCFYGKKKRKTLVQRGRLIELSHCNLFSHWLTGFVHPVGEKEVSLQEIRSGFEFVPGLFGIVLRGGYLYSAWPRTVLILIEFKFIVPELWQLVVFCTCRILPEGLKFVENFPLQYTCSYTNTSTNAHAYAHAYKTRTTWRWRTLTSTFLFVTRSGSWALLTWRAATNLVRGRCIARWLTLPYYRFKTLLTQSCWLKLPHSVEICANTFVLTNFATQLVNTTESKCSRSRVD